MSNDKPLPIYVPHLYVLKTSQGLIIEIPHPSKSEKLRVAIVAA